MDDPPTVPGQDEEDVEGRVRKVAVGTLKKSLAAGAQARKQSANDDHQHGGLCHPQVTITATAARRTALSSRAS
jgi:hypothetical protein